MKKSITIISSIFIMLCMAACTKYKTTDNTSNDASQIELIESETIAQTETNNSTENSKPIDETIPDETSKPADETIPDETSKPIVETKPTENSKPIVETKPTENSKPIVETKPTENSKPIVETKPTENSKPIVETKPTENSKPIVETNPTENSKPIVETNPTENSKPITSSKPTESISPEEPIHTHNYTKQTLHPTCTDIGYTTYSCSCGNSYNDNYISSKGHDWGNWTVEKKADIGVEGQKIRVCKGCSSVETCIIEALIEEFKEEIGVYYVDNVKYEYLRNHFDYSAYIQIYTLNRDSINETNIINEFEKYFGFKPTADVIVEEIGTYYVNNQKQTVYSYSINDMTYPFITHPLFEVYHQICTDGVSNWVGFGILGGYDDDWGELFNNPTFYDLEAEMFQMFYEKTGYSEEYISAHNDDFSIGYISMAGTMRTADGKLLQVMYIYCRENEKGDINYFE